ncbi:hypothetical protein H0H93_015305 [Arthromyces matolae]|nr:hypothetical protein H0H93_015305 [Arthromyces matolae]
MDEPPLSATAPATAPQVRSRVTVVCAECKRLKLKCDRRAPCGSCTKRDTVPRCVYSPAAAEKVDLHSVNNRLVHVEQTLSLITAGKTPPPFQSTYPFAQVSSPISQPATGPRSSHAVNDTTSPISIAMHDLVNIWLAHCQLDVFTSGPQASITSETSPDGPQIKLEPTPVELLQRSRTEDTIIIDEEVQLINAATNRQSLPPLHLYHLNARNQSNPYPSDAGSASSSSHVSPSATTAICHYLPPPATCTQLLCKARSTTPYLSLLLPWARVAELANPAEMKRQRALAQTIFNGVARKEPSPSADRSTNSLPLFVCLSYVLALGALEPESNVDHSFLYGLAGQALNVWEEYRTSPDAQEAENHSASANGLSDPSHAKQIERDKNDLDHVVALLLQIKYLLRVGPATSAKYLSETVFPMPMAKTVLHKIGKLVNSARALGLARDPELETGVRKNPQLEERRRAVWWEIMFYDSITSDVLGHAPLVSTNSYTTRLPIVALSPADLIKLQNDPPADEISIGDDPNVPIELGDDVLSEACPISAKERLPPRLIPPPKPKGKSKNTFLSPQDDANTGFFGVRCRLTLLIQAIKHGLANPGCDNCPCGNTYTLDTAARLEAKIRNWACDLPSSLRLESSPGSSSEPMKSSKHATLAAELAVLANRMIISVYVPLMRPRLDATGVNVASSSTSVYSAAHPWSPASRATLDAAQGVIHAARVVHRLRLVQKANDPVFMDGFYPLQKAVADALVICAHSGFASLKPGRSVVLVEEVSIALEILNAIGSPATEVAPLIASLKRRVDAGDMSRAEENMLKRKRSLEFSMPSEIPGPALGIPTAVEANDGTSHQVPYRAAVPLTPQSQNSTSSRSGKGSEKKRKTYPPFGFRDRGKANPPYLSKMVDEAMGRSQPTTTESVSGDFASSPIQETYMSYQAMSQQLPVPPPPQQPSEQSLPVANDVYRSRSLSVSQQPPQLQPTDYPAQYGKETDTRRRFSIHDSGQHEPHQQGEQAHTQFIVPPAAQYLPNQQTSRSGSFEAPHAFDQHRGSFEPSPMNGEGIYGPSSPYTANSSNGPLSTANSPYGSASAQTPVAYPANQATPPTFGQPPPPSVSSPETYYQLSYPEAQYNVQETQQQAALGASMMESAMAVQSQVPPVEAIVASTTQPSIPISPIYEKPQSQIIYEVKSPVDLVHEQRMQHYQITSDPSTSGLSTTQTWATTPQYIQAQQQPQQDASGQYWSTSQTYY